LSAVTGQKEGDDKFVGADETIIDTRSVDPIVKVMLISRM
jgi:hypothetical protein